MRPDVSQFPGQAFAGHHRHGLVCDHHIELPWCRLERLQSLDTTGVHRNIITKTREHLSSHVCQCRLVIDKQDAPVALRDGGFFQYIKGRRSDVNTWEIDGKRRALPWSTGHGDRTTVAGDNAIDYSQSHTSPLAHSFGREKWLKNMLHNLRRHTVSGITDRSE